MGGTQNGQTSLTHAAAPLTWDPDGGGGVRSISEQCVQLDFEASRQAEFQALATILGGIMGTIWQTAQT